MSGRVADVAVGPGFLVPHAHGYPVADYDRKHGWHWPYDRQ